MSNQPAPDDGAPNIIVQARRLPGSFELGSSSGGSYGTGATTGGGGGGGGGGGTASVGVVNVKVDNINNLAMATEAAQNVATALASIVDTLRTLDPNTPVSWFNTTTMNAGQLLDLIQRTEWVVTDRMFNNAGVGSSYTPASGNPRDYLNFESFRGPDGYASPNYTNMQGLIGILLHEAAHLSNSGAAFTNASEATYLRKNRNSYEGYSTSKIAINNEIWANDFMKAASTAFGLDTSTFNPRYGYGAVNPTRVPFP